jgi:hypothetical protein
MGGESVVESSQKGVAIRHVVCRPKSASQKSELADGGAIVEGPLDAF